MTERGSELPQSKAAASRRTPICYLRQPIAMTDYLRERSAQLEHELPRECVIEAAAVAEALIADGLQPWIGRVRDRRENYSGLLYPWRFEGRNLAGWTTHYVCCAGDLAFDPLIGEPVPIGEYAARLFRLPLEIEQVLDAGQVAKAIGEGSLTTSIRQAAYGSSSTHRPDRRPSSSS
jgi:hypothetical protein